VYCRNIVAVQVDMIEREGIAFDKDIGQRGGAMQARIHRRAPEAWPCCRRPARP
jgi:hypothetical protein